MACSEAEPVVDREARAELSSPVLQVHGPGRRVGPDPRTFWWRGALLDVPGREVTGAATANSNLDGRGELSTRSPVGFHEAVGGQSSRSRMT
jgi:hypothetical protein